SSSPALAASDLKGKIQDVRARFITAKDELVDLPIPKMKETLLKIEDFLDLCKLSITITKKAKESKPSFQSEK
ncbi:hypothetical protein FRC02_003295, partial [Tulasnella sp. 418]